MGDRQKLAGVIVSGIFMSGPLALLLLCYSTAMSPKAEVVMQSIWAVSGFEKFLLLGCGGLATMSCMMLCNCTFITSQSWAVRLFGLTFFLGVFICNGLYNYRWLFCLGT